MSEYRPDDLTPLLLPKKRPATPTLSYRQGVLLAYDAVTFANTVQVGDTTLTNVAVLNPAAIPLAAGDVVGLAVAGPVWFILGKIVQP